jgi:hypothetical protein
LAKFDANAHDLFVKRMKEENMTNKANMELQAAQSQEHADRMD